MLTIDTIRAAQNNDLAAVTEVIEATESRIANLAAKAALRMAPHRGPRFADYRDEFSQVGRVAVWEALGRFADTTVDAFERFMYTTVDTKLRDAVRSERNGNAGADENAMKTFATMLEAAEGDVYEAARLAQTIPPKGKRLSKERAEAARMAWQGPLSLDKSWQYDSTASTIADFLPAQPDEDRDGEILPKVGHGAALEALQVLRRYGTLVSRFPTLTEFASMLPALVEALEDTVIVPADPTERRYVLDAMAILRAAVSTATEAALPEDLHDWRETRTADSAEKHGRVTDVLSSMGAAQRDVLTHSFGIKGATDYGWGDGCDMDGIGAALNMSYDNVKGNRAKGRKAFAKRYSAVIRLDDAALADELDIAAAEELKNAGRK